MSRLSDRESLLPILLEEDPTESAVTSFSGLLPYLDLWKRLGMPQTVDSQVHICGAAQGWMDRQIVQSIILLNLSGGDCVTDIDKLEADAGLCAMFRAGEFAGLTLAERKSAAKRFRAARERSFPAATQLYSFLEACHCSEEEKKRVLGKAFIPSPNEHLLALRSVNTALVAQMQRLRPQKIATLDGDATLVSTDARTALFCYEGNRAYQPYNIWWAEQEMVLHSEFRDGNVPAGHEVVRVFQDALACLPTGVAQVYTRQDTAAYQTAFLAWCEREKEHPKYGRILFTISADVTQELRKVVARETEWTPEYRHASGKRRPTGREFAEIIYVPNSHALLSDIAEPFRFIAIRERMGDQLSLLDSDESSDSESIAPFPTITMKNVRYKLHAIVTNRRDDPAEELIRWHYGRCGKSEEAHSIMKGDFAGGQLPSAKFGANAAWWALMILSLNFQSAMKRLVLPPLWEKKRMKAVRFGIINTAGRLVRHSRQIHLRVNGPMHNFLNDLREAVRRLTLPPIPSRIHA
jgi:hypothetical protein